MKCESCNRKTTGILTNKLSIIPMCFDCYEKKIKELTEEENLIFGGESKKVLSSDISFFYKRRKL